MNNLSQLKITEELSNNVRQTVDENAESYNLIDTLPEEILISIFLFLDPKTILNLSSVSTNWYRLIQEPSLWRSLWMRAGYEEKSLPNESGNKISRQGVKQKFCSYFFFKDKRIYVASMNPVSFINTFPITISKQDKIRDIKNRITDHIRESGCNLSLFMADKEVSLPDDCSAVDLTLDQNEFLEFLINP